MQPMTAGLPLPILRTARNFSRFLPNRCFVCAGLRPILVQRNLHFGNAGCENTRTDGEIIPVAEFAYGSEVIAFDKFRPFMNR
jgi:hypothetical protein